MGCFFSPHSLCFFTGQHICFALWIDSFPAGMVIAIRTLQGVVFLQKVKCHLVSEGEVPSCL